MSWLTLLVIAIFIHTTTQSRDPILVIPPVFYWNTTNNLSVVWPGKDSEPPINIGLRVSAGSFSSPLRINKWATKPGTPVLFHFKVPPANDYKVEIFQLPFEKVSTRSVPGFPNIRYIFVETDKPLYKPAQTVRVRALPITYDGNLYKESLEFNLENPDHLILMSKSSHVTDNGFVEVEFELPRYLAFGFWRITVKTTYSVNDFIILALSRKQENKIYFKEQQQKWDAQFEVDDYDLPEFDVFIGVENAYSERFENNLVDVIITAKYSFGKPVSGSLQIFCSDSTNQDGHQISLLSTQINNGNFRETVDVTPCKPLRILELTATARDVAAGKEESAIYSLDKSEPGFELIPLRPGYTDSTTELLVLVRSNEITESSTSIYINVSCIETSVITEILQFKASYGEMLPINIPDPCSAVLLTAKRSQSSFILAIPKLPSDLLNLNLITNVVKAEYKVGEMFQANIQPGTDMSNVDLLVLCNNEQIIIHRKLQSDGRIEFPITDSMSFSCSLIVYDTENSKIDLLKFFVNPNCENSVKIHAPPTVEPSTTVSLNFKGKPNSLVGVTALDERVLIASAPQKLQQKVTAAANDWEFLIRSVGGIEKSIHIFGLFDRTRIQDQIVDVCQKAGSLFWQRRSACPNFSKTNSAISLDCQEKIRTFCVKKNPVFPPKPVCQQGPTTKDCYDPKAIEPKEVYEVSGQKPPTMRATAPVTKPRKNFPEIWLFDQLLLGSDGQGTMERQLPDSVTNWTILVNSWTPRELQLCSSPPRTITAFKKYFLKVDLPVKVRLGEQMSVTATVFLFNPDWNSEFETNYKVAICAHTTTEGVCMDKGFDGEMHSDVYTMTLLNKDQYSASKQVKVDFLQVGEQEIIFDLHKLTAGSKFCSDGPLLDKVKKTVIVEDRENIIEYYRSFILTPNKPRTGLTLTRLQDDILLYSESIHNTKTSVRVLEAYLALNVPNDVEVQSFRLEFSRFLPNLGPLAILNHKRSRRSKRQIQTPYLTEILKKLAVAVYEFKTLSASVSGRNSLDARLATLLADTVTFSDCATNLNMCGYSILRWPANAAKRSQWLTVMTTLLHCEQSVNPTIVCPALRWILNITANGHLKADFTQMHLASTGVELKFLETMVFLLLHQCSSYWTICDGTKSQLQTVSGRLYDSLYFMEQVSDPIAVAAATYTGAEYNSRLIIAYQDYLFKLVNKEKKAPFWTYGKKENSLWTSMLGKMKGWFDSSKKKLRDSNEVLMNSLGLLAFLQRKSLDSNLDLEPLADWLHDKQNQDGSFGYTMDTYFASRALFEFQFYKSGIVRPQKNLTVTLDCIGCVNVRRNVTDTIAVVYVPAHVRNLTIASTGMGKIKLAVRLQMTKKQRPRRHSIKKEWPVEILGETKRSRHLHNQIICLKPTSALIRHLYVQHGIFTGFVANRSSFEIINGTAVRNGPIEASSFALHFVLVNLTHKVNHCYRLTLVQPADTHVTYGWAPVTVLAHHSEHGQVGEVVLTLKESSDQPNHLLDKFCYPDGQCVCTEGACHGRICAKCNDHDIVDTTRRICNSNNFAAIIEATGVSQVTRDGIGYVKTTVIIKHLLSAGSQSSSDTQLEECKGADVWRRVCVSEGDCRYPRKETLYFLTGNSARWIVDRNSTRWTYFIQKNDQLEEFLGCGAQWKSRILNLTDKNMKKQICTNTGL